MILMVNFPLPPSVNEYLVPVASNRYGTDKRGRQFQKAHFVKSATHTNYLKACHEWRALHNLSFTRIQEYLLNLQHEAKSKREKFALRVDHYFAFEHSRLWTKNNLAEQIDADNRLKPCRDAIADLVGIDDKYFFSGYFEKVSAPTKAQEGTYIKIAQMVPRTLADIRAQLHQENLI